MLNRCLFAVSCSLTNEVLPFYPCLHMRQCEDCHLEKELQGLLLLALADLSFYACGYRASPFSRSASSPMHSPTPKMGTRPRGRISNAKSA